ncbi:MAG: septum site-determining protein MinC [Pseudomonadota bacterium]
MKQYELPVTKPVFRLKGGTLAATVLELVSVAPGRLAQQLAQKVAQAPQLLRHSPLIIALDKLGEADGALDVAELLATCRALELQPVALRALRTDDIAQARHLGIAVLPPSRARELPAEAIAANQADASTGTCAQEPALGIPAKGLAEGATALQEQTAMPRPAAPTDALADAPAGAATSPDASTDEARSHASVAPHAATARPTRVVAQPVRGGQQVYSDGDLVLLAPVSAGAEVMAAGHIHCYAPLRGRALAGVQGDASARIFCRELAAELIAIAGHYRIADDLRGDPLWGQGVQLFLHDDQLQLVAL